MTGSSFVVGVLFDAGIGLVVVKKKAAAVP